jgi:hypothetical protein
MTIERPALYRAGLLNLGQLLQAYGAAEHRGLGAHLGDIRGGGCDSAARCETRRHRLHDGRVRAAYLSDGSPLAADAITSALTSVSRLWTGPLSWPIEVVAGSMCWP